MHLVVFSICKDEGDTIGELLDRIPNEIEGIETIRKLVLSDGSSDDTVVTALRHGAEVVDGKTQRRLAYRFQQAVDIVLKMGADMAVNIDGDLQFDPEQIPELVRPILDGEAEFVAADRFTDPTTGKRERPANMPLAKYVSNRVGTRIVGGLSGQQFADVTCGFRAYSRRALLNININSPYTYTQESFQVLAQRGLSIASVPTRVTYYPGRKSRVVTSFFGFLASSAVNITRAYRDFSPGQFFGVLGALFFVPGSLATGMVAQHWVRHGVTTPYTSLGLIGVYVTTVAIVIWLLGLVADMNKRTLATLEKNLYHIKELRYSEAMLGSETPEPYAHTPAGVTVEDGTKEFVERRQPTGGG